MTVFGNRELERGEVSVQERAFRYESNVATGELRKLHDE